MNAHKLSATLTEDGKLVLNGLPFRAGETVEIIILEKNASNASDNYLASVENTLTEWDSEADDLAYNNL